MGLSKIMLENVRNGVYILKLAKSIVFRCLWAKRLAVQSTAYALRKRQGKQEKWKMKMKNNICVKEFCKILSIYRMNFSPINDLSLLEICQLYITAKYKPSIEAVTSRCSIQKVFLKMLRNSQENPSARVSF